MNLTPELEQVRKEVEKYARDYGLDFFDVIFEVLDWNQINEVAALGGFPNRYPHWRFGMEYEDISKRYAYGLSKIYEMVINNDPCYAYLLYCNHMVDQKLVMAHVYGHCDFFKNNIYFALTNRKMMDEMANHRSRIQRYINKYGHDMVEDFVDACLSIDSLIDMHLPVIKRQRIHKEDEEFQTERKMKSKPYMDRYVNPPEFLQEQRDTIKKDHEKAKGFPENPVKDVMGFLLDHAPLDTWERDVLSMIREEAYYYVPQAQTKMMNEGWACVAGDTLVSTQSGFLRAKNIAENKLGIHVNDGKILQKIYDWAIIPDRKTVEIITARGLRLKGSDTHRVLMKDDEWKSLDDINIGDKVIVDPSSARKEFIDKFNDTIVAKLYGAGTVYDFSVANTHRYSAAGFINHNSYWHSKIMTQKALKPSELIDYADHHSGTLATSPGQLNPYKIGIELFRNIEERWDKGQFGKEYYDCTDFAAKKNWDKKAGLGREKIFEVRRIYNDINFIDTFLTPEFCREHKLFVYSYNISSDQYEIADRAFESIKQKLLFQLTNMGRPMIEVVDANYGNRSELMLKHIHDGIDLKIDYAKQTLQNIYRIWKRPVNIDTILNGSPKILCYDGENHKEFRP